MRTPLLALCGVFGLAATLLACDAAAPATPTAPVVALDAGDVYAADILYDLEPLALGERFSAITTLGEETVELRSTRQLDGYAVAFVPADGTERVRVTYLYEGQPVAASFEVDDPQVIEAGVAEDEPTSWHVIRRNNGSVSYVKDYDLRPNGPTLDRPSGDETGGLNTGTLYTTPAGERVAVTHVQFDVIGGPDAAPEAVRFEAPRGIELTSTKLRRR